MSNSLRSVRHLLPGNRRECPSRRATGSPLLHPLPCEISGSTHARNVSACDSQRRNGGFIVLGLLIAITLLMAAGVLIGKVVHASRYPYEVPLGAREMVRVSDPLEIRYGALVTGRVAEGDAVWIRPVGEGRVAVFAGAESSRIVGFVTESDLHRSAGRSVQLR
jgi:hypothetical protein